MSTSPIFPADRPTPDQLVMPRTALCECLQEACQDLVTSRDKLSTADTADQLVTAVIEAHQILVDHGETMGEFARLVKHWQTQADA